MKSDMGRNWREIPRAGWDHTPFNRAPYDSRVRAWLRFRLIAAAIGVAIGATIFYAALLN